MAPMAALDPLRLAERQLEIDRQRTTRFPDLFDRKLARMGSSPLAFLRGSAPLFYEILRARPEVGAGPPTEGWLVGDAHLENFGAYAPSSSREAGAPKRAAVFDLNDFDEAVRGPWRWDVLRLATSVILAGRELGVDGVRALGLCETLIESHARSAFGGAPLPLAPRPVAALIHQVQSRSKRELLGARTLVVNGERRFGRGTRYRDLPPEVERELPRALELYGGRLSAAERPSPEQLQVVDCAQRIAGTGSLGALRIAVLTRGKGGVDGGWIFDMKEQLAAERRLAAGRRVRRAVGARRVGLPCLRAVPTQNAGDDHARLVFDGSATPRSAGGQARPTPPEGGGLGAAGCVPGRPARLGARSRRGPRGARALVEARALHAARASRRVRWPSRGDLPHAVPARAPAALAPSRRNGRFR